MCVCIYIRIDNFCETSDAPASFGNILASPHRELAKREES